MTSITNTSSFRMQKRDKDHEQKVFQGVCLLDLPPEVLHKILTSLDSPASLGPFSSTCWSAYYLVHDIHRSRILHKELFLKFFDPPPRPPYDFDQNLLSNAFASSTSAPFSSSRTAALGSSIKSSSYSHPSFAESERQQTEAKTLQLREYPYWWKLKSRTRALNQLKHWTFKMNQRLEEASRLHNSSAPTTASTPRTTHNNTHNLEGGKYVCSHGSHPHHHEPFSLDMSTLESLVDLMESRPPLAPMDSNSIDSSNQSVGHDDWHLPYEANENDVEDNGVQNQMGDSARGSSREASTYSQIEVENPWAHPSTTPYEVERISRSAEQPNNTVPPPLDSFVIGNSMPQNLRHRARLSDHQSMSTSKRGKNDAILRRYWPESNSAILAYLNPTLGDLLLPTSPSCCDNLSTNPYWTRNGRGTAPGGGGRRSEGSGASSITNPRISKEMQTISSSTSSRKTAFKPQRDPSLSGHAPPDPIAQLSAKVHVLHTPSRLALSSRKLRAYAREIVYEKNCFSRTSGWGPFLAGSYKNSVETRSSSRQVNTKATDKREKEHSRKVDWKKMEAISLVIGADLVEAVGMGWGPPGVTLPISWDATREGSPLPHLENSSFPEGLDGEHEYDQNASEDAKNQRLIELDRDWAGVSTQTWFGSYAFLDYVTYEHYNFHRTKNHIPSLEDESEAVGDCLRLNFSLLKEGETVMIPDYVDQPAASVSSNHGGEDNHQSQARTASEVRRTTSARTLRAVDTPTSVLLNDDMEDETEIEDPDFVAAEEDEMDSEEDEDEEVDEDLELEGLLQEDNAEVSVSVNTVDENVPRPASAGLTSIPWEFYTDPDPKVLEGFLEHGHGEDGCKNHLHHHHHRHETEVSSPSPSVASSSTTMGEKAGSSISSDKGKAKDVAMTAQQLTPEEQGLTEAEQDRLEATRIKKERYPPLYFEGSFNNADDVSATGNDGGSAQNANRPMNAHMRGKVYITDEGEVQWIFVARYSGEDQWLMHGIQIGGLRSKAGIMGIWSSAEHDEAGPNGPFWYWPKQRQDDALM